jgi:hypothetical protein
MEISAFDVKPFPPTMTGTFSAPRGIHAGVTLSIERELTAKWPGESSVGGPPVEAPAPNGASGSQAESAKLSARLPISLENESRIIAPIQAYRRIFFLLKRA